MAMASTVVISYLERCLPIRYDTEYCEVSLTDLLEHFDIKNTNISLSEEIGCDELFVTLPLVVLEDGSEGYKLNGRNQYRITEVQNSPPSLEPEVSIIVLLEKLPLFSSLHVALSSAQTIHKVLELPTTYDGYCLFELPPCKEGSIMQGMEQKHDGHVWTTYKTSTCESFKGSVKISKCCGYLRCYNLECPFVERTAQVNECQWKGKLRNSPPIGPLEPKSGSLVCRHCGEHPECINICEAYIYYCTPREEDRKVTTRCAIHVGVHEHPVEKGVSKIKIQNIDSKVAIRAQMNPYASCKNIEVSITRDLVMDMFLAPEGEHLEEFSEEKLHEVLQNITPLCERKRMQRAIQASRKEILQGDAGLDSILKLKRRLRYPFIHSALFPGQLGEGSQPHIFKMSTQGPASGVDLVNKMRPGGPLGDQWIHFDHIHRIKGWCTMGAHVYDPYIRELLTIATCEFKVQDQHAQVQFWEMVNGQMLKNGFPLPQFQGFMSDEAQQNWIAVRKVYNGGPEKIMVKERSCVFHWEMNMVDHTKKCITPAFQEEHKFLCRKWKKATSEYEEEKCKQDIREFWTKEHVKDGELQSLQLWLAWWDVRVSHWGGQFLVQHDNLGFVPTTNLSECKHSSMRLAQGTNKYISLFEATAIDLSLAALQSAHYKSFMEGRHHGTGPNLKHLTERLSEGHTGRAVEKKVIDLTAAVLEEAGLGSPEFSRPYVEETSIRRKRSLSDANVIRDTDSHRPEYSTITSKQVFGRRQTPTITIPSESNVHEATWAIRRTPVNAKVTCFGQGAETNERCAEQIIQLGKSGALGVPAPSYKGRFKYPGGTREQFFWFCNHTVCHTWNVHKSALPQPGEAPGIWLVARGTKLLEEEANELRKAGFVFSMESANVIQGVRMPAQPAPSNTRPGRRDGKLVRWRSKLTKEYTERVQRAKNMEAEILRETMIVPDEMHVFNMQTKGSIEKNVPYSVTIGEYPRCTCDDFMQREAKRVAYVPCKHIYFVFIKTLGLQDTIHEYMHQAALSKIELYQALHGRRVHA